MEHAFRLTLVITFGASTMALEILASKVMAPDFGTSIYTWGSIISMVLVVMSVGYAVGGVLSTRGLRLDQLCRVLCVGAAYVCAIPFFSKSICAYISDVEPGPRLGPLLASAALFGIPIAVGSMVTPFVTGLYGSEKNRAGLGAGIVFAISTGGLFVGTIATSFYLVSWLAVSSIILGVGCACLVIAGIGALRIPRALPTPAPEAPQPN